MRELLLAKIHARTATIAVIGLALRHAQDKAMSDLLLRLRSGQALAVAYAERGFPVIGSDVDGRKVAALHRGGAYVPALAARPRLGHEAGAC